MKFIFTTFVKNVYDHEPVLESRKQGNETIFVMGQRMKRVVFDNNMMFEYEGEEVPEKGKTFRVTVEEV